MMIASREPCWILYRPTPCRPAASTACRVKWTPGRLISTAYSSAWNRAGSGKLNSRAPMVLKAWAGLEWLLARMILRSWADRGGSGAREGSGVRDAWAAGLGLGLCFGQQE